MKRLKCLLLVVTGMMAVIVASLLIGSRVDRNDGFVAEIPVVPAKVREIVEQLCGPGAKSTVGFDNSAGCETTDKSLKLTVVSNISNVFTGPFYSLSQKRVEFCLFELRTTQVNTNSSGSVWTFYGLTDATWFTGPEGDRRLAALDSKAESAEELVSLLDEFRESVSSIAIDNGSSSDCLQKQVRLGGSPQVPLTHSDNGFN
jgi:hypothetical protein